MNAATGPLESLPSLDQNLPNFLDPVQQERLDYLRDLKNIKSASTNSKVKKIEESLKMFKIRVFRGYPEDYEEALPTSLICEPAGKIIGLFSQIKKEEQPSTESMETALRLSTEMRKFYQSEDERFDAFVQQLSTFLSFTKSGQAATGSYLFRAKYGPDGFREKSLPSSSNKVAISLLIEAKWEVGTSGDPTMQICLDYAATAGKMSFKGINGYFPCLLVTISGAIITAQLGVVGKCAQVEFLGCHSFESADMRCGAQFLAAIKSAVQLIEDYYDSNPAEVQHVDMPYWCNLCIEEFDVVVEYQKELKKGNTCVYVAAVKSGRYHRLLSPRLVIKFVRGKYGEDAHRCLLEWLPLHTQRVCPRLFGIHHLAGGWTAVVMEYMEAIPHPHGLHPNEKVYILETLTAATRMLHSHDFVHGDLREPNILLSRDEGRVRPFIIDFDMAGKVSEAIYPVDLNFAAFPWLELKFAGAKIEKAHDFDALDFYVKEFLDFV